jgi:hypothetical protein
VETGEGELERGEDDIEACVETSDAGVDGGVAPCSGLGLGEEAPVGEEGVGVGLAQPPPAPDDPAWLPGLAPPCTCVGCVAGESSPAGSSSQCRRGTWPFTCGGGTTVVGCSVSTSSPRVGYRGCRTDVDAGSYCPDLYTSVYICGGVTVTSGCACRPCAGSVCAEVEDIVGATCGVLGGVESEVYEEP